MFREDHAMVRGLQQILSQDILKCARAAMRLLFRDLPLVLMGCVLLGTSATAAEIQIANGSFQAVDGAGHPVGWDVQSYGHTVSVDNGALRIMSGEQPTSTYVRQKLSGEELRTSSRRLSGKIRTKSIQVSATLVAIVTGGEQRLFVDDMRDRVVAGDTGWTTYNIDIPAIPDAEKLEIGILVIGSGVAWFDELSLEHVGGKGDIGEAQAYVREAVEVLRLQYLYKSQVDWDKILHVSASSLREDSTLRDAHGVVASIIARLDDRHAQFVRPRVEEGFESSHVPITSVFAKRERNIGHIVVPKWSAAANSPVSTNFVTQAHGDIESVTDGTCGWVIDLNTNTGGNMWPMLAALGPVIGEGDIGAFVDPRAPESSTVWWYREGVAGTRKDGRETTRTLTPTHVMPAIPMSLPVAVVVGSDTASSGEATAIALIGRPNSRFFGSRTAGWATANIAVPLSDGAKLVFPSGYLADRRGRIYPDGVMPDDLVDSGDAISAAEQWLLSHLACTNS